MNLETIAHNSTDELFTIETGASFDADVVQATDNPNLMVEPFMKAFVSNIAELHLQKLHHSTLARTQLLLVIIFLASLYHFVALRNQDKLES